MLRAVFPGYPRCAITCPTARYTDWFPQKTFPVTADSMRSLMRISNFPHVFRLVAHPDSIRANISIVFKAAVRGDQGDGVLDTLGDQGDGVLDTLPVQG